MFSPKETGKDVSKGVKDEVDAVASFIIGVLLTLALVVLFSTIAYRSDCTRVHDVFHYQTTQYKPSDRAQWVCLVRLGSNQWYDVDDLKLVPKGGDIQPTSVSP